MADLPGLLGSPALGGVGLGPLSFPGVVSDAVIAGGIGFDEIASASSSTSILPSSSVVPSCASSLEAVHSLKTEVDPSVCCSLSKASLENCLFPCGLSTRAAGAVDVIFKSDVPVSASSVLGGISSRVVSGDADPSLRISDDPVVLALSSSVVEACPESLRLGLYAADLDFTEISFVHPLELDSVSSPPLASPYQAPALYPVRSSLSGCPPCKLVPPVPSSGFDFGGQSFPPLAKPSGISKIIKTPSAVGSAISPGIRSDVFPGPARASGADPISSKASWASLVSDSPSLMKLSYFKPASASSDGRVSLSLPPEIALIGAASWENTIVGFFLDKLPFSLVESSARRMWDNKGLVEVLSNGSGFFFFKFSNKAELSGILDGGPWYFGGRPIFLKPWSPGMILSKDGCKKVPIWVRFFNIPLEFWTAEGLSRIASTVGSPLHADHMTSSLKRLSYARICLEICLDDPLPSSLDLILDDGRSVEVLIEYNWVPKRCPVCMVFGHLPKNCKKCLRHTWVPKSTIAPAGRSEVAPRLGPKPDSDCLGLLVPPPVIQSCNIPDSKVGPGSCYPTPAAESSVSGGCEVSNSLASPRNPLRSSINRFAALSPVDDPFEGAGDPLGGGDDPVKEDDDPVKEDDDPVKEGDDPFGSGVGDPFAKDDPLAEPFGKGVRDPIFLDDPIGSVAGDPIEFDDPTILKTSSSVPKASSSVPKASSSVPPVGDSSALSPTIRGSVVSSPSSSSSFSSTPLIARRLKMVDELEIKQGKQMKLKKKNRSAGNSKGKFSLKLDD